MAIGVEPTGNARAWEYGDEPLIRMRNTYIAPGDATLDEMIADIDDGLLLDAGQPLGDHDLSDGSVVLAIHEHDDAIQIDCTLDERCRSASQQALRSMNIMFGLPERLGLD